MLDASSYANRVRACAYEFMRTRSKAAEGTRQCLQTADGLCKWRNDSRPEQTERSKDSSNLSRLSHYLAPPMYDYLCGKDAISIKVSPEDVLSIDVTLLLQKVTTVCTYM